MQNHDATIALWEGVCEVGTEAAHLGTQGEAIGVRQGLFAPI